MHPTAASESHAIPFELEMLASAHLYQKWLVDIVEPYLGKRVLELGAGIGNMSRHIPVTERLVLSEVNPSLIQVLESRVPARPGLSTVLVDPSKPLHQVFRDEHFDTVLSFNVLEHIQDDAAMMRDLIELLQNSEAPGIKRIVTLVPAHQWAYGEIDKSFEHFRRYSAGSFRKLLRKAGAPELNRKNFRFQYFNLPGLIGWWFNGRLLGRSNIGAGNMKLFELLCPLIRPIDNFLHKRLRFPMGNSLLAVYVVPAKRT